VSPAKAVGAEQAAPTLLPPDKAPPSPSQGDPAAQPQELQPKPAYTEDWVRKLITYLSNAAAQEWGPEMRASELELGLLVPPLCAVLNAHAPDVTTGGDPQSSILFVAGVIVIMGARRALAIRRQKREALEGKKPAPRPTQSAGAGSTPPLNPSAQTGDVAPPTRPTQGNRIGGLVGDGFKL
jgi:hypothetical protein